METTARVDGVDLFYMMMTEDDGIDVVVGVHRKEN